MRRVLVTFSKYDPQLGNKYLNNLENKYNNFNQINIFFYHYYSKKGYVQGMNFIAGNLLYHSEEYICFWLLVMLFEIFELRDVFLPSIFQKKLKKL